MIDPGNELGRIIAFCSESDRFLCRKRKTVCASDSMENGRFMFTHLREANTRKSSGEFGKKHLNSGLGSLVFLIIISSVSMAMVWEIKPL